ncbi:hypothetical protein [Salinicoccus sp. HZC-1]|uniref:hypothetical protein n=1 Tax=Salinicoccus sp. HZC-1 TaxID=3385497 RepID=UPI00398B3CEF
MKLKVKIKDTGLTIEKVKIPSESTVADLITQLTHDNLININFTENLILKGHEDKVLSGLRLSAVFADDEKAVIYNTDMKITLTHKKATQNTLAGEKLLDYSKVVQTTGKFCEMTEDVEVKYGTLFYIQQQHQQYLVRYEEKGIEFFHFREQYNDAFLDSDRSPFLRVELKARNTLSSEELKWIRSIMFPSREKRNPIIHMDKDLLGQAALDDIAMLVHRLIVIIGKFKKKGEPFDARASHVPAYVQVGERCSAGYITMEQLENIR